MTGTMPASLDIADLTGDGRPEILLTATLPEGNGKALYVFVSRPVGYRLAVPIGGASGGKGFFGASGYELADVNADGKVEIRARSGGQVDTYVWDGLNFALME